MVPQTYLNFFITAASAGGALIGLLFVSVSIAPERTVQARAPVEARVMSSSTFIALLNGFFISLAAVLPNLNIGYMVLVISLVGVSNCLNHAWIMLRPWPSWQNVLRRLWLTVLSLCLFVYEFVIAIQLLNSPAHDDALILTLCILLMSIYGTALLRAWLLLGVQRTGLMDWLNPLYEVSKQPVVHPDQSDAQLGDSA
jgi:hypothetical protein